MRELPTYEPDFEEYIRQGEPDKKAKAELWQTAIGLQQVDGLHVSNYLLETARRNIEGEISIQEAQKLVDSYYHAESIRNHPISEEEQEADKVSSRITEIIAEKTFTFSPTQLIAIHRRLFTGVYKFAGQIRDYNITKKEWVLDGETVLYASADMIRETLEYDFAEERKHDYQTEQMTDVIHHLALFCRNIWQIHPFGEGNTRTTAVFMIKYMRALGLNVSNDPFKANAWYFRNALVRANYTNVRKGIQEDCSFLERFFQNIIFGESHPLLNRELHIRWSAKSAIQSAKDDVQSANLDEFLPPKCKNCTIDELATLRVIHANPKSTQKEIAAEIRRSERTVKSITIRLTEQGIIQRINGKRNGYWEIINK